MTKPWETERIVAQETGKPVPIGDGYQIHSSGLVTHAPHEHTWVYHQPATCGGTPVWCCEGEGGCGRYETKNPDPAYGPSVSVSSCPGRNQRHAMGQYSCSRCIA